MRADLPAGTVTFLFTDVEGSTKLLHELGAGGYADALAEHRRVIREACSAEGGVEVDTQGDAFFFAFPTAMGALAAASSLTEALAPGPIQVRVGLHTGTPLVTEEGYVGDDVHLAARIAASAHGAQVVLSAATAAHVGLRDTVAQGDLRELGEHRLKDIAEPVAIYQLGDASFPPLKTISSTNLPRPASSFLGRERELAEVLERIRGGARLITLTGPGGTGKTRLAIETAAALVPEHRAGVFWVGLASLRDPALVPATIAQTLGAKDGLAEHIAERELLLLLDNLEQVIEVAPELASLLERCPNLTLLVTSRELLRVRGEVEYPVPPLAEPEAVSLFCQRAQLKPSEEIAELCARLDSLPLAVELAAARTKALTVSQILERLSQRLHLLRGGRDADPRQQTLRATIEWSYDLLSEEEQQLFARLSVFAGGCTLESAEEVADADLDTLQSLVEKSLLRFTEGRYWTLETIRAYADERLQGAGEADSRQRRLGESLAGFVERAEPELHGPAQSAWLDRLDREHDNLRSALSWSLGGNEPLLGGRIAAALFWFWQLRSHLGEGERWLAEAIMQSESWPAELRARLLQGHGQLTYYRGETVSGASVVEAGAAAAARDLLGRAVALWRRTSAARPLAETLAYLGIAAGEAGDQQAARAAGDEAVLVARNLDDRWALGLALWACGATAVLGTSGTPDPERAEPLLEESVELLRPTGDRWALAAPLFYLGVIARQRGDLDRAWRLVEEATEHLRAIGDKWRLTSGLRLLATLSADRGDTLGAARLADHAHAVEQDLGRLRVPA